MLMNKIVESARVEGELPDIFNYSDESDAWRHAEVTIRLGGAPNREFHVPAADTGAEIFFNNRELLARFASLCQPDQKAFLNAIRATMEREGVDTLYLKTKWSKVSHRTLKIRKINTSGSLNIYL